MRELYDSRLPRYRPAWPWFPICVCTLYFLAASAFAMAFLPRAPWAYAATDWGKIEAPKFDFEQLDEMKKECSKHCLSTCNYILAYCYDMRRVIKWTLRQAMHGFRGTTDTIQ